MTTAAKVLKAIGNPHLSMCKGEGYIYFILDDGADVYETRSVYTMHIKDLPLEAWVEEGRACVEQAA
jgi:hypothetical protein